MGWGSVKNATGVDSRVIVPFAFAGAGSLSTIVAGWNAWGWYTILWSALLLAAAAVTARATGAGALGGSGEADMIEQYLAGR